MKLTATIVLFIILVTSCSSNPTCECFETRLEIKKMLKNTSSLDEMESVTNSEEYKALKEKKKECKEKIEPAFFEQHQFETKNQSEEELLMEHLSDCDALNQLMSGEY